MNRKPTLADKFVKFLEGKGFYLTVLVCVAAVGLSGWFLARSVADAGEEDDGQSVSATAGIQDPAVGSAGGDTGLSDGSSAAVSGGASIEVSLPSPRPKDDEDGEDGGGSTAEPTAPTEPTEPAETTAPAQPTEPVQSVVESPAPLVYTWPVKGEVLTNHSVEALVYDQTMGDWRVHAGVDIAAPAGTNVLAAAAGTVTAVDHHDLMGTTVVIDHGQGMVSTYANLQTVPTVTVGDKVYTGSIIGAVGETAIAESALAGHLHFQLACDGVNVDPLNYLPAQ